MRVRESKEHNYKGIYLNGKTIRLRFDNSKPILELEYPEFYDVKITNKCFGNCKYCYQSSVVDGEEYENIVEKSKSFFGSMTENQRPFQVAIGGGNPNEHPEFIELLEYLDSIGVVPNYTTNGMGLTEDILEATRKYSGGVALTAHKHLTKIWTEAIDKLFDKGVKVNLHLIIHDKFSVDYFTAIYKKFSSKIDYFVLLPLMPMGRQEEKVNIDYPYLLQELKKLNTDKIAFGANFYPYINKDDGLDISLYEPEILSKYADLKGTGTLHKSSFDERILRTDLF